MKIEIESASDGIGCDWTVRCGERWEDHFTLDEALGCIARILLAPRNDAAGILRTKAEHDAWEQMNQISAQQSAAQQEHLDEMRAAEADAILSNLNI